MARRPRYFSSTAMNFCASDSLASSSARGRRIQIAHTAERALESRAPSRPQYAIVALRLPDQTGIRLIPELLSIEPRMRVVVFTGYPSIHTAIEAIKLGATYYLPKPANATQLIAALDRRKATPTRRSTKTRCRCTGSDGSTSSTRCRTTKATFRRRHGSVHRSAYAAAETAKAARADGNFRPKQQAALKLTTTAVLRILTAIACSGHLAAYSGQAPVK